MLPVNIGSATRYVTSPQSPVSGLLRANAFGQANAANRQRDINELLGSDPRKNFKIFDAFVKTNNRLAKDNLDKDVLIDFILKEIESKANTQQAINEKIQGLYAKLAQPLPSQPQVEYTAGESVANLVGALTGQQGIMMATQAEATARRDQQFKEALANDQLQRGITERQLGREERSLDLARGEQSQLEMMRLQQIGALSAEDRQNERRDYEYGRARADAIDDREWGVQYDEMRRKWDQQDRELQQMFTVGVQQYLDSLPPSKKTIAQIELGIAADALAAGNIDAAREMFTKHGVKLSDGVWEALRIAFIERKAEAAALQGARQGAGQTVTERDLLEYRKHLDNLVAKGEMTKEEADSQYESIKGGFDPMDPFGPGASLSGDIGRGITGRNPSPQGPDQVDVPFGQRPIGYQASVKRYHNIVETIPKGSAADTQAKVTEAYNKMLEELYKELPRNQASELKYDIEDLKKALRDLAASVRDIPLGHENRLKAQQTQRQMLADFEARWGFTPR